MTLSFRERAQMVPFVQKVVRTARLNLSDTVMDERQLVPFAAASPEADPKNLRNFSENRLISDAQ